MLSVKLNGEALEVCFETFVGGNEYKYTMEFLRSLEGSIYSEESRKWYVPKKHVDAIDQRFPDKIAWHNAIEDIKGIRQVVLPDFTVTDEGLEDMKLNPYPFQTVGISFLHDIKQGLLADEMGLGKTPQAIGAIHRLWKKGLVKKALIVCPSSLKYQWVEEIQKFTDHKGIVIDGTPTARQDQYEEWQRTNEYLFAIINYELVRNDIDTLVKLKYDAVAADEVHRIKNWASKTSQAMKELEAPYKFGLTGTPMQNKPDELFNIFDWLNPLILGNWWAFRNRYVVLGEKFNKKNVVLGYKRLGELRRRVAPYMLRRMKVDVAKDLPEMTFHTYHVSMTPEQQRLQDTITEDFLNLLKEINEWQALNVADTDDEIEHPKQGQAMGYFNLLVAVADAPELFRMSESPMVQKYAELLNKTSKNPKIDELVEICKEQIEQGNNKVVIFTQFERMQRLIVERLKEIGGVQILNGKMKPLQRQESIDKFKYNQDINFFVTTDAGNYGINLQFANVLVNVDIPWNPAIYDQRAGRIHRIGSQHEHVNIIDLITRDSIDERIQEVLYKKRALAGQIVEKNEEEKKAMNALTAGVMKKLLNLGKKKKK